MFHDMVCLSLYRVGLFQTGETITYRCKIKNLIVVIPQFITVFFEFIIYLILSHFKTSVLKNSTATKPTIIYGCVQCVSDFNIHVKD